MIDSKTHPSLIVSILEDVYGNLVFKLAEYQYSSEYKILVTGQYKFLDVPGYILKDTIWLDSFLSGLSNDVVLCSNITLDSGNYHIPMIDFISTNLDEVIESLTYLSETCYVFESGRSFHAYGTTLITEVRWPEFLGKLLLINTLSQKQIVDTSWISFCLAKGHLALRWSHNSSGYLAMPKLITVVNGRERKDL